jgi:5-methylcytosine-specific restriction endonuclease McrA
MSYGLTAPVLVLNRSYAPVRVTTARQAFEMLYQGRAFALSEQYETHDFEEWASLEALEDHEHIGTPGGRLRVPRLVLLCTFDRVPRAPVRLSRRNVFLRDGYQCQYCAERPPVRELNLDHVIPRSRGGRSTWDNLVTSCRQCNLKKGRALPEECGMALLNEPTRPRWSAAVQLEAAPRWFKEWDPFLAGARPFEPVAAE